MSKKRRNIYWDDGERYAIITDPRDAAYLRDMLRAERAQAARLQRYAHRRGNGRMKTFV